MLLLEQDTIKKEQIKKIPQLDVSNDRSERYKVKTIWQTAVYASKLKLGYLIGLYYLVV